MIKKITMSIFYVLSILFLLLYIAVEIHPNFQLSEMGRLVILCGSSLFLYFGGLFLSRQTGSKNPLKVNLWIFFILYLSLFITLTLFDPMWGRTGGFIPNWQPELLEHYIQNSLNLVPFKTIGNYINSFNSLLSTRTLFFNLIGNFVCLMPLGFFLPLIFSKQKDWKVFLFTTTMFVLGIEILQFLTLSGSCDIDDLILNVLGAFVMYQILKTKTLQNLIENIFLLEHHKINVKSVLKIFTITIIVFISLWLLIKYREYLYNENLKKIDYQGSYDIQIIDETESCLTALETFYEDELYQYQFSCIKSDSVYAIINGEKYLVKDLLNHNPTEYPITIETLASAGLVFFKENKYETIDVSETGNIFYQTTIENEDILEVEIDHMEVTQETTRFQVHLKPKASGETTMQIKLLDSKTEKEKSAQTYHVRINDQLEVEYDRIGDIK